MWFKKQIDRRWSWLVSVRQPCYCRQLALCLAMSENLFDFLWNPLQLVMLFAYLGFILFKFLIDVLQIEIIFWLFYHRCFFLFANEIGQLLFVLFDIVFELLVQRPQSVTFFDQFGVLCENSVDVLLAHLLVVHGDVFYHL